MADNEEIKKKNQKVVIKTAALPDEKPEELS